MNDSWRAFLPFLRSDARDGEIIRAEIPSPGFRQVTLIGSRDSDTFERMCEWGWGTSGNEVDRVSVPYSEITEPDELMRRRVESYRNSASYFRRVDPSILMAQQPVLVSETGQSFAVLEIAMRMKRLDAGAWVRAVKRFEDHVLAIGAATATILESTFPDSWDFVASDPVSAFMPSPGVYDFADDGKIIWKSHATDLAYVLRGIDENLCGKRKVDYVGRREWGERIFVIDEDEFKWSSIETYMKGNGRNPRSPEGFLDSIVEDISTYLRTADLK